MTIKYSAILLFGLSLAACSAASDEVASSPAEDATSIREPLLSNCSTGRLSDAFQAHTCAHYSFGPYQTRSATTTAPFPWFGAQSPLASPSNNGRTHIYYTVNLSGSGPYTGTAKLKPEASGDYALFYSSALTSFTVKEVGGGFLASDATLSPNPGAMSCPGFSGYRVFNLSSTKSYEIAMTGSASTVNMLFELVTDSNARWYKDADADTWGDPSQSILTACAPPATHPASRGSDCNESNASINPTAVETCGDSIDSNCNGADCS
jgi:hypothetical protein